MTTQVFDPLLFSPAVIALRFEGKNIFGICRVFNKNSSKIFFAA